MAPRTRTTAAAAATSNTKTTKAAAAAAAAALASKRKAKEFVEISDSEDTRQRPVKRNKQEEREAEIRRAKQWAADEKLKREQRRKATARGVGVKTVAATGSETSMSSRVTAAYVPPTPRAAAATRRPAAFVSPSPVAVLKKKTNVAAAAAAAKCRPVAYIPPPQQQQQQRIPAAAAALAPLEQQQHHAIVEHDNDDDDSGYETGDSVEEVRMARLAKKRQQQPGVLARNCAALVGGCQQRVGHLLTEAMEILKIAGLVVVAFMALTVVASLVVTPFTTTPATASHATAFAPSFATTIPGDTVWTERYAYAVTTNQLLPCPPAGNCDNGDLISCGFLGDHVTATAIIPSIYDDKVCVLAPFAASIVHAIQTRLHDLSVATMCFEHSSSSSMEIRNHGSATTMLSGSANNMILFAYYDFVQDMDFVAHGDDQAQIAADTLAWLKFASDRALVSGVTLEWKAGEPAWIGLSSEALKALPLSSRCMATRAILKTLESTQSLVWDVIIKSTVSFAWSAFRDHTLYSVVLLLIARALFCSWRKRQHKIKVQNALVLVYKYLQADTTRFHRANVIRDEIKCQLFPDDFAAQSDFCRSTWQTVFYRVDRDARVLSYDKISEGTSFPIWQWQGLAA